MSSARLFSIVLIFLVTFSNSAVGGEKIIIALDSGNRDLIEHTLPALALAVAKGVDCVEIDVGATKDHHLVVFKDPTLNRLTDVATVFPDRHRDDGGFYLCDFTLAELRQLRLHAIFAEGVTSISFAIPTLAEALALVHRLEQLSNIKLKIALEITAVYRYREQDIDIASLVVNSLAEFGYTTSDGGLWLQSYDAKELQRLKNELLPEAGVDLPLVQMIDDNDGNKAMVDEGAGWQPYNYDWMFTFSGLHVLAGYAQAIALPKKMISDDAGNTLLTDYIQQVKKLGLLLYIYGVDETGPGSAADSPPRLPETLLGMTAIDGFYTNNYPALKQQMSQPADPSPPQDLPPFFSTLNLSRPQLKPQESSLPPLPATNLNSEEN
jgi:glycerophosphoryl diester phosphodiesterase